MQPAFVQHMQIRGSIVRAETPAHVHSNSPGSLGMAISEAVEVGSLHLCGTWTGASTSPVLNPLRLCIATLLDIIL
jgi:hypothetical protein